MLLAQRLDRFKPSATLAINARALAMRQQGIQVTSLAVGEPDFPTPEHVCEAAKKAIDAGYTRYTDVAGIPELRKAAAGYFFKKYHVEFSADQIMTGNGGKQVLFNLMQVLLNPGDEVLIPAPYWLSYPDMVRLADGEPVPVLADASQNFKVTVAQLDAALTAKTRVLVLNSPSNPTGSVYSAAELEQILLWAVEHHLFVISDEIYDQLVYAPAKPYSCASWLQRYPEQFAIVNGLSKSFAMTGWRVGYGATHPQIVKAMAKIQGQSTSNVCSIAQHAAVAALNGPDDSVVRMREAFLRRRDMAWEEISRWQDVVCPKPDGAFYLFLDIHRLFNKNVPNAPALCEKLLQKARVATVPGDSFGAPDCMRLSYAVSDDALMSALARMKAVLYSL